MFGSLFRRAEASIDNALNQTLLRIGAAIPIAIGLAFGIVALFTWGVARWGLIETSAGLSAAFLVIGLLAFASLPRYRPADPSPEEGPAASATGEGKGAEFISSDVALDALTSLGPTFAPLLVRPLFRNLPLLIVLVAVLFVLGRSFGERPRQAEPGASIV